MGQVMQQDRGKMDITDQRQTFSGFMTVTVWGSALTAMSVAMFTVAFAINAGWFAGVAVFLVLGVGIGLAMRMSAAWWAFVIGSTIALLIGGGIVAAVNGVMN
jgi:hypothetical protein